MHCDEKRTIFALNQKLKEAKEEREILLKQINIEKNFQLKKEIETKLNNLDKFITEVQSQLSEMR